MILLFGPFDEVFELQEHGPRIGSDSATTADRDLTSWTLRRMVLDPRNRLALRRAIASSSSVGLHHVITTIHDLEIHITRVLERGRIKMLPSGPSMALVGGHAEQADTGQAVDLLSLSQECRDSTTSDESTVGLVPHTSDEPAEHEIRDLKLRCKHEFDGNPRTLPSGDYIAVVPGPAVALGAGAVSDDISETVTLLCRDDRNSPPPKVVATSRNGSSSEFGDMGDVGGSYHGYDVHVAFDGYLGLNVFSREFWRAFSSRTTYRVEGAFRSATIDVHYPYIWTLKLAMPPISKFSAGICLESKVKRQADVHHAELSVKAEASGWDPSTFTSVTKTIEQSAEVEVGPSHLALEAKSKETVEKNTGLMALGPISLQRSDGAAGQFELAKLIGDIAEFAESIAEITKVFKEIPKAGWYTNLEIQLLSGELQVAWGWREHTDQRVYRWFDALISMTLFSIKLELGFGLSAASFKTQLYVNITGDAKVEFDGQRSGPDMEATVAIPLKGTIKGTAGFRAEAGNLAKFDAHVETGIELSFDVRLNDHDRALSINGKSGWTGLKAVVTASVACLGFCGMKTWEEEFAKPYAFGSFAFPSAKEYVPNHLTRNEVTRVVEGALTDWFDIRVIKPDAAWWDVGGYWTTKQIVDRVVDEIEQHETVARDLKTIEGIALSVREDLEDLGGGFTGTLIREPEFLAYIGGPRLRKHLDAAPDLGREFLCAAGVRA